MIENFKKKKCPYCGKFLGEVAIADCRSGFDRSVARWWERCWKCGKAWIVRFEPVELIEVEK